MVSWVPSNTREGDGQWRNSQPKDYSDTPNKYLNTALIDVGMPGQGMGEGGRKQDYFLALQKVHLFAGQSN